MGPSCWIHLNLDAHKFAIYLHCQSVNVAIRIKYIHQANSAIEKKSVDIFYNYCPLEGSDAEPIIQNNFNCVKNLSCHFRCGIMGASAHCVQLVLEFIILHLHCRFSSRFFFFSLKSYNYRYFKPVQLTYSFLQLIESNLLSHPEMHYEAFSVLRKNTLFCCY